MKKQVLLSFLASLVCACTIIALAVGIYTRDVIDDIFDDNLRITSHQMAVILRQYDNIFNAIQIELNREGRRAVKEIAEKIGNPYKSRSSAELKEIARAAGADEVYLINRNGVVFNTSFQPDMNYNLFGNSIFFENFLRNVFGKGKVFTPKASIGMNTGTINKYVYYSPKNSDCIYETSYNLKRYIARKYSADYYKFMSPRKLLELTGKKRYLVGLDLITVGENRSWSLLTTGQEVYLAPQLIKTVMQEGRFVQESDDRRVVYLNVTEEESNIAGFDDVTVDVSPRILKLVYNTSAIKRYARNLLILLICVAVASIVIALVFFSLYFSKKYIGRILDINVGLEQITRGDYSIVVEEKGHDELTLISSNINRMAEQIKVREGELRDSETRFRSVFEHAPLGIVILALDRQVRFLNHAAEMIIGCKADEIIGRDYLPMISPDNSVESLKRFSQLVRGDLDSYKDDRKLLRKDGSVIWGNIVAAVIKDAKGHPTSIIIMLSDITEKKSMEQQLIQAQKMDAIGKLASGVAHDFNNLLQVIIGYSRMLHKYIENNRKGLEVWQHVVDAGESARALVKQLLTFGRAKPATEFKPVGPNEFVESFIKMISRILSESIDVDFIPAVSLPLVNIDPRQMEQVMMNLCVNARDAMPSGGHLTLSTKGVYFDSASASRIPEAVPGYYVRFSVTDTGKGMDEETILHIFEPFYSTKEVGKGTGIGLATAYAIVKSHNGFIRVESIPNEGSSFNIFIPVRSKGEKVEKIEDSSESTENREIPIGTGELLLLCEDEPQVRELAVLILNEGGYQVVSAKDGEDAIKMFDQYKDRLDMIILDVIMPKKSGREVYKYIRSQREDIPVLFSTGYSEEMLNGEFGGDVIHKPYRENDLLQKISEMIGKK